jgi:hypothetical protein
MHNGTYYKEKLSANRFLGCYHVAPSRIKQYLDVGIQEAYVCYKATRVISLSVSPCVFFFSLLFPSWS